MRGLLVVVLLGACTSRGPTTFDDVAPILARSCTHCHRPEGIAPFSLETYDDVFPNGARIAAAITSHEMPPWDAVHDDDCNNPIGFAHDESLSDAEIQKITEWIDHGAPAGSPNTRAISDQVSEIANPDLVVTMVGPYQPAPGDDFRCFTIDPGLDHDVYVTGIDFVPGNRAAVHHSSLVVDPTRATAAYLGNPNGYDCSVVAPNASELLAWTPGISAQVYPPGVAQLVPAHSLLVIQLHYAHGTADDPPDQSGYRLTTTTDPPSHPLFDAMFGGVTTAPDLLPGPDDRGMPEFFIPLGTTAHTETMDIPASWVGGHLYGIQAHAHFAATEIRAELHKADGSTLCLLKDQWRFVWQRRYLFDAPLEKLTRIDPADTIEVRCTYNNSPSNTALMDYHVSRGVPLSDIHYGGTSLDEMCHVMAVVVQ